MVCGDARLELPGPSSTGSVVLDGINAGSLSGRFEPYPANFLQSVTFHFVNFGHFRPERMIWKSDDWQLVIDPVKDLKTLEDQVSETGGYIITHTAVLTKSGSSVFTGDDAEKFYTKLIRFLSFVSGRRMNAVLPIGIDTNGQPSWTVWGSWMLDPWQSHDTWADLNNSRELAPAFEGYMRRCNNSSWAETIDLAIYWYVEANRNPLSTETNVILTQTAFERLAWEHLVRQSGMSKNQFANLKAVGRIRQLLQDYQIPSSVPNAFSGLRKHWTDAADALTQVRNDIVHPEQKHAITSESLRECRQTGLWMLELLLLRLFDFDGVYMDRCQPNRFRGKVVRVPWNP